MKHIKTYESFLSEGIDFAAYDQFVKSWSDSMKAFLIGKKLGNLPVEEVKVPFDGIVEFIVRIDELQLNWMLKIDSGVGQTPKVYIGISSPNKRGVFEKNVTGRNASNEMVWKTITDIYNGKYKR